jgi:hypothetical protein
MKLSGLLSSTFIADSRLTSPAAEPIDRRFFINGLIYGPFSAIFTKHASLHLHLWHNFQPRSLFFHIIFNTLFNTLILV